MTKPRGMAACPETDFPAARRSPVSSLPRRNSPQQDAAAASEAISALCADRPFGTLICDVDLQILAVNPAACARLGYRAAQDLVQCNLLDFVLPGDHSRTEAAVRDVLDGRLSSYVDELRLLREDKSTAWVLCGLCLTRLLGAASPVYVQVEIVDISALKETQAALAKSEELFRTATEYSPIGLSIIGPDGRYKIVNQAFCRLLGYEREVLIGKSIKDVTKTGDPTANSRFLRRLASLGDEPHSLTNTYVGKSGEEIVTNINIKTIRDETGEILYGIAQVQDVTARFRQLEELHEAKELAQVTIASIAEGLIRTDIEGRITLCNAAAANMLDLASSADSG